MPTRIEATTIHLASGLTTAGAMTPIRILVRNMQQDGQANCFLPSSEIKNGQSLVICRESRRLQVSFWGGTVRPMVDPMIVFPAATACLGAWVLLTGHRVLGLPRWPLEGAMLRADGAYSLIGSLFVIALAIAGYKGLAFVAYAVLALALAAFDLVARKLKVGT